MRLLTSRSGVRASLGASCQYTRTSSCANDLQLCSSICHIKATRHNRRLAHFQPLRVPCLPARPCPFTTPCLYNACARLDSSATAVIAQLAARRSHNPKVVSSILTTAFVRARTYDTNAAAFTATTALPRRFAWPLHYQHHQQHAWPHASQ